MTSANVQTATVAGRVGSAVLAALLGLALIYGAGLANSTTLHNAAHDTRHAITFPCH